MMLLLSFRLTFSVLLGEISSMKGVPEVLRVAFRVKILQSHVTKPSRDLPSDVVNSKD